MKKTLFISFSVLAVIILLFNLYIPDPTFKNKQDELDFAVASKQYELAEKIAFELINNDITNIDYYVIYIKQHFNRPIRDDYGVVRDNQPLYLFLSRKSSDYNTVVADNATYGLGLYYLLTDNYEQALENYLSVHNKKIKYVNNSIGFLYYYYFSKFDSAEIYFRNEIANNGELQTAYSNLTELFLNTKQYDKLQKLINNDTAIAYIDIRLQRKAFFYTHHYFDYLRSIIIDPIQNAKNYFALFSALLIVVVWLIYLKKIDIYEPEKWKNIILVFLLGILCTLLVFPLSDIIDLYGNFYLNGNIVNDFLYCIFTIGFIEETVKIIPLLIILKFTKLNNEPVDYIIYASVSALGFAFLENIQYFNHFGLELIHGRALISVVIHMVNTSLIAYGMVYNKYVLRKNKYLIFVAFLLLASFVHGFFDFWLINDNVKNLAILSIITVIVQISLYNSFINNTLNQSVFYNKDKIISNKKLQIYLFVSLFSVFVCEYIAISLKYCVYSGNIAIYNSVLFGSYILPFITSNFGRFRVVKGKWENVHYFNFSLPINYIEDIVNKQIELLKFSKTDLADIYLPNQGLIVSNHTIKDQPNWYYIKLSRQVLNTGYSSEFVMIRPMEMNEKLKKHDNMLVGLFLIPTLSIAVDDIQYEDMEFIGWAKIN